MKNRKVILQKTVYLCGQDRDEGACVQPNSNIKERVHQSILCDKPMEREYNFKLKPWEFFPTFKKQEGALTAYHSCGGWCGLRMIFPYIGRNENVECLVTVIFNSKDTSSYWNEDLEIKEYARLEELYNFHAESDYYAVMTGSGFMLSKGKNSLFWEIDDGYIKWDCDRENGALIFEKTPLIDLFPESDTDGHGVGVPYKIRVIVDAAI